jgi:O-antigen/teichoic acid export membrane protein
MPSVELVIFARQYTMSLYKNLLKQTAIYGLATVIPRMMSFLLTPLYVSPGVLDPAEYGQVTMLFAYMIFFNVILSYGMETAFFRFYNKEENKKSVIETATISIFWTTFAFFFIAMFMRSWLADWSGFDVKYVTYAIWILVFDALVIVPFSELRAKQRPMRYAMVKIGNVALNFAFNIFFLIFLPKLAQANPGGVFHTIYIKDFEVGYVFISNIIASAATLLVLSGSYFHAKWQFDKVLWKRMLQYGWPILFAGIAFAINEQFDKILLGKLLPADTAESEVGVYSACYKMGLFMVLFRTAYTLGIEPFFFSHAGKENATQTYATVTKYFVIFGSLIQLCVIVTADILKQFLVPNSDYWAAMKVVPLIILANFFLGIYTNLSVWYKLIDKTHIGAWISLAGAAVTLILNFALIPLFEAQGQNGYMGSAIATIAAYGSMMAISYFMGAKAYPIPYDMKRIGGYLGVSILFSVVSFYFFRENYYVGTALVAVFVYFIYYNEKETLERIIHRRSGKQIPIVKDDEQEV